MEFNLNSVDNDELRHEDRSCEQSTHTTQEIES